jgi:acetyltransferase-like isoleucine patch superfamily enzyme
MTIPFLAGLRTRIRPIVMGLRRLYFRRIWGMDIGEGCHISFSARLDKTNPRGIHIGDQSIITLRAIVLSHDFVNNRHLDTRIGRWCFVGANSIVMAGVEIGDHSIVGAGSVVAKNVPPRSLVAGNPARIIEADIETGPYGMRGEAWAKVVAVKP